jgi:Protein of unknown function (DUF669)
MAFFDATQIDPATGQQSFPLGTLPVVIRSSSKVANKAGTGGILVFQLAVIDGSYKGFTGPHRLNMWNASAQACEIASKELSALCHVTGKFQLADDSCRELFNIPFCIIVIPQTGENAQYTQIASVTDIQGKPPMKGQMPSGPTTQQPQQPQGGNPGGWQGGGAPQQPQQPQQLQPTAQPSWNGQPQPGTTQGPGAQPGWGGQPQQTQQPQQPTQPTWSQGPQGGGQPYWSR